MKWKAELGPVVDLFRHLGIAGLESGQVREFKQLQEENTKLKRLVADLSLDKVISPDVLAKNF